MTTRTIVAIAAALMALGFAASSAQAQETPVAQSDAQVSPDAPTPSADDAPVVTCPRCGADCPMPYGRRGRGMDAPRARRGGHGRHFTGRGPGHGGGFGRGAGLAADRMLRHASGLELTESQITQLETLSYETKTQLIDLESSLDKARLEMKRQMETDAEDLSAMKKRLDSMAKIKVDIQELKLKNWIDARKVLTDEQKNQVKERYPRLRANL